MLSIQAVYSVLDNVMEGMPRTEALLVEDDVMGLVNGKYPATLERLLRFPELIAVLQQNSLLPCVPVLFDQCI